MLAVTWAARAAGAREDEADGECLEECLFEIRPFLEELPPITMQRRNGVDGWTGEEGDDDEGCGWVRLLFITDFYLFVNIFESGCLDVDVRGCFVRVANRSGVCRSASLWSASLWSAWRWLRRQTVWERSGGIGEFARRTAGGKVGGVGGWGRLVSMIW